MRSRDRIHCKFPNILQLNRRNTRRIPAVYQYSQSTTKRGQVMLILFRIEAMALFSKRDTCA